MQSGPGMITALIAIGVVAGLATSSFVPLVAVGLVLFLGASFLRRLGD